MKQQSLEAVFVADEQCLLQVSEAGKKTKFFIGHGGQVDTKRTKQTQPDNLPQTPIGSSETCSTFEPPCCALSLLLQPLCLPDVVLLVLSRTR